MTTTAEVIVNDVSTMLQDINKQRWSDAVLMRWINEAEQLVSAHKPESVALVAAVALSAGVDQEMPSDAVMLIRVRRNTGSGLAVQLVDEDTMNAANPAWPGEAQAIDVENVIYDPEVDPLTFMVSPPNTGGGNLSMVYAQVPSIVNNTSDLLSVNDSFMPLVKDYVMYRALQMETEGQNLNRAAQHLQTFLQGLGINSQMFQQKNPMQEVEQNG